MLRPEVNNIKPLNALSIFRLRSGGEEVYFKIKFVIKLFLILYGLYFVILSSTSLRKVSEIFVTGENCSHLDRYKMIETYYRVWVSSPVTPFCDWYRSLFVVHVVKLNDFLVNFTPSNDGINENMSYPWFINHRSSK